MIAEYKSMNICYLHPQGRTVFAIQTEDEIFPGVMVVIDGTYYTVDATEIIRKWSNKSLRTVEVAVKGDVLGFRVALDD